ncbi:MAG: hypothetical protein KY455_11355 [Euryarchaeota archaeon]|nr:hypothetical protein [Euryarchaeota archaeon]
MSSAAKRLTPALLSFFLVLLVVPNASAHGEATHIPHVNPLFFELEPGERETQDLAFDEGEFQKGWVFLVNAVVTNGAGPIQVDLVSESDETVLTWTLPADGTLQTLSGSLPETGFFLLSLMNEGDDIARVSLYYDQSCNCAQKPVPAEIPGGLVVFQVDPHEGDDWEAVILEPPAYDLKVHLALRVDHERGVWPDDFEILETSDTTTSDPSGRDAHHFAFTADRAARFYFFAEVVGFHPEGVDRTTQGSFFASVTIVPLFELTGSTKEASGMALLWPLVSTVGLLAVLRRSRRW